MKVLVTGVKGQLGYDVMNELAKRGYEGVGVDVDEMDITDRAAVEAVDNCNNAISGQQIIGNNNHQASNPTSTQSSKVKVKKMRKGTIVGIKNG